MRAALDGASKVFPIFIFDPRQYESPGHRSEPGFRFLIESLEELIGALRAKGSRLNVFHGNPSAVVDQLVDDLELDAVFANEDYTLPSRNRDEEIRQVCDRRGIDWRTTHDALLTPPGEVLKADGSAYSVFTPFFVKAQTKQVAKPQPFRGLEMRFGVVEGALDAIPDSIRSQCRFEAGERLRGGEAEARRILSDVARYANYANERDQMSIAGTTRLSPHLKFGTCSPRQAYWAVRDSLGEEHPLIRQLYWRDFFTHVGFFFPHVYGEAFREKYSRIPWSKDTVLFEAWKGGRTGFPVVDAGMRELNETGYMHNRARMIVASFLTKDLRIDWRWGERYFARRLADYDPAVNNGNWQWAASTGCDAQPYFRIFNPWRQQARFDPECVYIKRWVPELRSLEAREIHRWSERQVDCGYPAPIVDHKAAALKVRMFFESL